METNIEAMIAINNLGEVRKEIEEVKSDKIVNNLAIAGCVGTMIASCVITRDFNHIAGFFGFASLLAGLNSMGLTRDLSDLNNLDREISVELIKSITSKKTKKIN